MRIKKIAPVTPANGNIENNYGTSQENTYSQEYINGNLDIEDITSNFIVMNTGFDLITLNSSIWKQGKHIWGYLTIQRTDGNKFTNVNADNNVGTINSNYRGFNLNSFCALSSNQWNVKGIGYIYIGGNSGTITILDNNVTGEYSWAKIQLNYVLP